MPPTPLFRPQSISLLVLIGSLFAIGPLATDMFLPALAALPQIFTVDVPTAQQTMSVYLIGFALGQLVYGPLADRYGRRPVIVLGAAVFGLASFACALAPSIETLVTARFFQALGVAFGQVLGRAVVRDLHEPSQTTRVIALASIIMAGATLVSPTLGAFLLLWTDWWMVFVVHGAYGLTIAAVVILMFRESAPRLDPDAIRPLQTVRNFAGLLADRAFASYAVAVALVFGVLFTFLTSAPFVFVHQLGMAPAYFGLVFIPIALANMVTSAVAARITRRGPSRRHFATALAGLMLVMTGAFISVLTGWFGVGPLIAIMMLFSVAMAFIVPLGFSGALAPHPMMAGSASSLIGLLQAVGSALASQAVGVFYDGTPLPMAIQFLTLSALALVTFLLLRPRRA